MVAHLVASPLRTKRTLRVVWGSMRPGDWVVLGTQERVRVTCVAGNGDVVPVDSVGATVSGTLRGEYSVIRYITPQ